MFIYKNEKIKKRARQAFSDKAVAINQLLTNRVTFEDTKKAFKAGFEKGLGVNLSPLTLTEDQWSVVKELSENRYESDDWNFSR
jgi:lipoate-protein ligase A